MKYKGELWALKALKPTDMPQKLTLLNVVECKQSYEVLSQNQ